jgi:hypothetical protein
LVCLSKFDLEASSYVLPGDRVFFFEFQEQLVFITQLRLCGGVGIGSSPPLGLLYHFGFLSWPFCPELACGFCKLRSDWGEDAARLWRDEMAGGEFSC